MEQSTFSRCLLTEDEVLMG